MKPNRISFCLLLWIAFASLMVESCGKGGDQPTVSPMAENPTADTPDSVYSPQCFRPYSDKSIWNVPIDWSRSRIHPENDLMMDAFFQSYDWIGSDTSQYAPNIYFITNETPLVMVQMRENSFRDAINDRDVILGQAGGTVWMPLPDDAQPAPGTDAQLAIVNLESGEEWGIIYGKKGEDGRWSVGGAYRYHIKNSGIPPEGFVQRGAGIGQLAGVVRPCEVERGDIGHAVTLAYDFPCSLEACARNGWPYMVPPFTLSDGKGVSQYDIPEGARMIIRPEITLEEIHVACREVKGCIAWAQTMQKYGGFIVDNGGHPKTYAEGDATAHWDPKIWSAEMLRYIPKEWYAVLDWD